MIKKLKFRNNDDKLQKNMKDTLKIRISDEMIIKADQKIAKKALHDEVTKV